MEVSEAQTQPNDLFLMSPQGPSCDDKMEITSGPRCEGTSKCQSLNDCMEEEDLSDHDSDNHLRESNICIGDTICFRSMHRNMYISLDDESSGIAWHDESDSCLFTIYPAVGQACNAPKDDKTDSCAIHDGAVVCLFAPNGYFLSFDGERLAANRPYYVAGPSAEFIVHIAGDGVLRNHGKVFLRNRASLRVLEVDTREPVDPDQEDDVEDVGSPKRCAVETPPEVGLFQVRRVFERKASAPSTPRKRRVLSVKWRNRLLVPKLPRYARRFSQECAYMSKAAPRRFMMRSAMQVAVAVP